MSRSRPTIRDVAHYAGVSHQTVSRVINGRDDVLPETRSRVEAAILELGFYPNAIARSMAQGTTKTLACIAPNLIDFTFASVIEGAEQEARKSGYFLFSASAEDPETFREIVNEFVGHRRVDGLIVINPYADNRYQYIPEDFPLVFVGASPRGRSICSVSLDDKKTAYDAAHHLILSGHKEIAMITGPMSEDCSRDRADGFWMAVCEAGGKFDPAMVIEGDWSATSGQDGFVRLVQQGIKPTAIFAQNDRMALGVLHAARDMGVQVPEELAVIGVDDMPLASYFDPPLTTMKQDIPAIGKEAACLLIEALNHQDHDCKQVKFDAQLVVRRSTCCDKGGG